MAELYRLEEPNMAFFIINSVLIPFTRDCSCTLDYHRPLPKIDDGLGISAKCLECAVGMFDFENKY
jgi:hypothetical protein